MESENDLGSCDYLVIGGGAAGLAFADTTLVEQPDAKLVVVDPHDQPGGHWNDAYPFVHLHQPSCVYGVQSELLEGGWAGNLLCGQIPWRHRASKAEILAYYRKMVDKWERTGRLTFYGGCKYEPSKREQYFANGNTHCFCGSDGSVYHIKVNVKLVNAFLGENVVPSKHPLEFPVNPGIQVVTPNALYDELMRTPCPASSGWCGQNDAWSPPWINTRYVVLGAGKTGMDTVEFLQRDMKVPAEHIIWVISRDVWMVDRSKADPTAPARALVKYGGDKEKASDELESQGYLIRLHKDFRPSQYRYPLIDEEELELMRRVTNQVRRGRVASISHDAGTISIAFADGQAPLQLPDGPNYVFVHCASPGPYGATKTYDLFASGSELNLAMLDLPPVTVSMAMMAKLESARRSGTLALEFGRELFRAMMEQETGLPTEVDVLKLALKRFAPGPDDTLPLRNAALFVALLNEDPKVGLEWLKANRLSMLSVPGVKAGLYEVVTEMIAKQHALGYSAAVKSMLHPLQERLKAIEGL